LVFPLPRRPFNSSTAVVSPEQLVIFPIQFSLSIHPFPLFSFHSFKFPWFSLCILDHPIRNVWAVRFAFSCAFLTFYENLGLRGDVKGTVGKCYLMGIRWIRFGMYGFDSFLNVACIRGIHDEKWYEKYLNKSNFVSTNLGFQSWLYVSWWWNKTMSFCRFVGGMSGFEFGSLTRILGVSIVHRKNWQICIKDVSWRRVVTNKTDKYFTPITW